MKVFIFEYIYIYIYSAISQITVQCHESVKGILFLNLGFYIITQWTHANVIDLFRLQSVITCQSRELCVIEDLCRNLKSPYSTYV